MKLKLLLNIIVLTISQTLLASDAHVKIASNDVEFCEILEKYSEEYLKNPPEIFFRNDWSMNRERPNPQIKDNKERIVPRFLWSAAESDTNCFKLNENFLINTLNLIDQQFIQNVQDYIESLQLRTLELRTILEHTLSENINARILRDGGLTEANKPKYLKQISNLRESWNYFRESFPDNLIPIKFSAQIFRNVIEALQSKNQEFLAQKTDKKSIDRLIEISDRLANFDEGEMEYKNAYNELLEGEMMINDFSEELFNKVEKEIE